MELDQPDFEFVPSKDRRPRIPEPLPVRLVAVADMVATAAAGDERQLDDFYVTLLGFLRASTSGAEMEIVYQSENFRLVLQVREAPVSRDTLRPIGIEVRSLDVVERELVAREVEFVKQKGVAPGQQTLLCQDPSGNWVEFSERREIG